MRFTNSPTKIVGMKKLAGTLRGRVMSPDPSGSRRTTDCPCVLYRDQHAEGD